MLRKDREKHEKEDREKHMDMSLATVKLLSKQQKALTAIVKTSENKHQSLEKSIVLKDKQHKRLTEQHKELTRKNESLTEKVDMLSEKLRTLFDMVNLHEEQNKKQTRKEKCQNMPARKRKMIDSYPCHSILIQVAARYVFM